MNNSLTHAKSVLIAFPIVVAVFLSGCGGGGGNSPTPPATMLISGTAAAGTALVGSVSVRDSSTKTQPVLANISIGANGHYEANVSGLTPPFAFLASGTVGVGGNPVSLYSAATASDANGTVNINPFTDLIIRNIAAMDVGTYLSTGGMANLTTANLNVQNTALTAKLAPALAAVGLPSNTDLMHTTFNANGTGPDLFLDMVKVSTTSTTATITNVQDPGATLTVDTTASSTTLASTGTLSIVGLTPAVTPPVTHAISGNVSSSLAGVTITLTGPAAPAPITTDASGNYIVKGLIDGSYTVTPSKAGGYTFTPTSASITIAGADSTGNNFAATPPATTYMLSGTVSGAASQGVTMTLSVGTTGSTITGNTGSYSFTGLVGNTSYTVTPSLVGYHFTPTSTTTSIAAANATANFVATANVVPTYSISGTVSGAIASGVTLTLSGGATTTSAPGYSFAGLSNGSYTITPSLAGYTFNPTSTTVSINNANGSTTNFVATANAVPTYTVSGTVTGPWVGGLTINMTGAATGTILTDVSGAYSFTTLPAGSYTFTPATLAGYNYTPQTLVVTASTLTVPAIAASSAITSHSISGAVSYTGAKTGGIRVLAYDANCLTCSPQYGTTIIAPGPYTIRGIRGGSFVLIAEMDAQGTGQPNANNPFGAAAPVTITNANVTVNVALADPVAPTPVTPTGLVVAPSNGVVLFQFTPPVDVNGQEIATSYQLAWGTDTAASTGGGTATLIAQGSENKVPTVLNLVNGVYYFKLTALVGVTASAPSNIVGPVTVGATTGFSTVSGTVSFTVPATGPMYVGVHSRTTGGTYFTTISAPVSPQAYSVAGVPDGNYDGLFAFIDMNNNGYLDKGDISNMSSGKNPPPTTVAGNTTGNLTLASANANVFISTEHTSFDASYGVPDSYQNHITISNGVKRVATVTLFSGSNVAVPVDMGWSFNTFNIGLDTGATRPVIGDTYQFLVIYSDLTFEVLSGSVSGVLDSFATVLAVTPTPSRNVPTFTWGPPTAPPASYGYLVSDYSAALGGQGWFYPSNGIVLPSGTTSLLYNFDGKANPTSLVTGTVYRWSVIVVDTSTGNTTSYWAPAYTP